jgi:hypothetical protein
VVQKSGTDSKRFPATNQAPRQGDAVVCSNTSTIAPQLPTYKEKLITKQEVKQASVTGVVKTSKRAKQASKNNSIDAKAPIRPKVGVEGCQTAASKAPVLGGQSPSISPIGYDNGPAVVADCPLRIPAQNQLAKIVNEHVKVAPIEAITLAEPVLVTSVAVDQASRVETLTSILLRSRRPILDVPPYKERTPEPNKQEYGGWTGKPIASFDRDMARYKSYEKYNADRNQLIYGNEYSKTYNSKYTTLAHIDKCGLTCECDARRNGEYVAVHGEYTKGKASQSSRQVVERQRQFRRKPEQSG